jgi:methylamine dehydrogenase accessory protein MauD
MTGLIASQSVLWVIVILLCIVCIALARQIGVLHERIAPLGAMALNRRIGAGEQAPHLVVATLTGATLDLGRAATAELLTSCLIFFLSPACPVCKTLLPVLKSIRLRERGWLQIVLASDGDSREAHRAFVERQGLAEFPYVLSQTLGMSYGVSRLPYAVLIDEQGLISALGVVNTREHIESLFEAKRLQTPNLQQYLQARSH